MEGLSQTNDRYISNRSTRSRRCHYTSRVVLYFLRVLIQYTHLVKPRMAYPDSFQLGDDPQTRMALQSSSWYRSRSGRASSMDAIQRDILAV